MVCPANTREKGMGINTTKQQISQYQTKIRKWLVHVIVHMN